MPNPAPCGLHLIDKGAGGSSFSALGALKRALGTRKVGHAGTLDPFATGLLVALSGKMTKAAFLCSDMDKEYVATIRFGKETDTLDTEGTVIHEAPLPSLNSIEAALPQFLGVITQVPPAFSAIKIDGKRAYAQARRGQDVQMPSRQVRVDELEVLDWNGEDLVLRIRCSKGTYIRSISRDLALAVESRGFCTALRRTAIGPFSLEAQRPEEVEIPLKSLTPTQAFQMAGVLQVNVNASLAALMRAGVPAHRMQIPWPQNSDMVFFADEEGREVALMEKTEKGPRYRIVFDGC
ncbi:MAG: tRNA pseudouridine(55) synthase TruB [Spirochaetales bacterium]|nr:tRNA pseudouridine(55) synthase TruB [Spirochaetales bacterium]